MKKFTILVVDDELFFRRLYADLLSEDGYQVETVDSGENAFTRLKQGGVDILLTDLVMPGIGGLEILRLARLLPNPPEVILATGHATLETAIQALKNGARDYLVKPFKPEELRHLVRTCLEQRRLLDENTLLKSQIHLFQRGQDLASLLEVDRLLPQALSSMLQEIGGGRGVVFLTEDSKLKRLAALEGIYEEGGTKLAMAALPHLAGITGGGLLPSEDLPELPEAPDLRSACIFPLLSGSTLLGGMILLNPAGADLQHPIPLNNLVFLAEQTAIGLANALLYQGARDLIYTDDLTGLYNYRYLQLVLDREIRRTERYGLCFTLVFIDLDYFKQINDTFGHLAGSAALKEVAGLLRNSVREVDLVFRYGGDEFTALLVETDAKGGGIVAERIRRTIEKHTFLTTNGKNSRLTATIGFAAFPEHAATMQEIIDLADRAMYYGKQVRNVTRGAWEIGKR